ncbi:MAG TPA: endopeptidase La, partial [Gaiellaceae bacterium]|nr:endopeptidase La [Gaiellaceae bacterium]
MLLVPLEDIVVFPNMNVTLTVDVGTEERVLLVPRHENDYASVGTVAEVTDRVRLPGGGRAVALSGLHRGVIGTAVPDAQGALRVEVEERPDSHEADTRTRELEREYRAIVEEILDLRGDDGRISAFVRSITDPGALADTVGYSPDFTFEQKVELLETLDVKERLALAIELQRERHAEMQVRRRIRDDVEEGAQKQQREYILRRQMESIRKELGEDDASVVDEFRRKLEEAELPEAVREQAERELARLERQGDSSPEASMIRNYLDWILAVPWGKRSDERLDPTHTREVLDSDHEGLDDVKDRIVEYIAVRKLREERGIEPDKRSGAILTLVGPPGTGKTSIGESIARALGREFVRMSLGGVRDEAEIRGHRRTYIGALPGRLVRALRDAGTMNPVILLDEVDKVGADWRGDPSSALLEVLDPAQNHSFRDHYLDLELDLSEVVFIATANVADSIPGPLLDRMEVIRFDGYTTDEKIAIARGYLWPRQRERNGLREDEISVADVVLETVVSDYTREAGVRQLERELGKLLRKTATQIASGKVEAPVELTIELVRDALGRQKFYREAAERTAVPGVATGLAVTGTGGDVLFVEATSSKGDKLVLTGQLGDVMKESVQIALSSLRSRAEALGIEEDAFEREFHVHVPAGAIPKDGPSAGITMA